jgi:mannose-1-phosphate guanylyltransferase
MLDWAVAHLAVNEIGEAIVNVHHFPEAITEHVQRQAQYGMRIAFSREDTLMGTGGGVKRAEWFLKDAPFVLRNVDVLAGFRLHPLLDSLDREGPLAVLAVQDRRTSRALLWDQHGHLCGRLSNGRRHVVRTPDGEPEAFGFTGVHAVSPRVFEKMPTDQPFCIVEFYLEMARRGETITRHRVDGFYWRDLGTPDSLGRAEEEMARADTTLLAALGMPGVASPRRREIHPT